MTRIWLLSMMAVLFLIHGLNQLTWAQESQTGNSWLDAPVQDDGPPGSMVLIPEGEFLMGDNDGSRNERPEHTVWLDAYSIDRYEVTMAEYQKLLDITFFNTFSKRGNWIFISSDWILGNIK